MHRFEPGHCRWRNGIEEDKVSRIEGGRRIPLKGRYHASSLKGVLIFFASQNAVDAGV